MRDVVHLCVRNLIRGAGCSRCYLYLRLHETQVEADQYKAMFAEGLMRELEPVLPGQDWEPCAAPFRTYGDLARKVKEVFG